MDQWSMRRAKRGDLDDIARMFRKLLMFEKRRFDTSLDPSWALSREGRAYIRRLIGSRSSSVLLVEAKGRSIGFLFGSCFQETRRVKALYGELTSMFIEDAWRGKGIGRQLVEEFLIWCTQRRVRSISVMTAAQNKDALELYRRFGFGPQYSILERKL